jgi:hypothetical protein
LRRRRNLNRPPWMNQEIVRAVRRKKSLWKRDKNKVDKTEYKEQEKKTRNMIRNAKKRLEKSWQREDRATKDHSTPMLKKKPRRDNQLGR